MNNYDIIEACINDNNLSGLTVLNLFIDWNGGQLLTSDFFDFIYNEGYLVECYDDDDDDDDDEKEAI